MLTYVKDAIDQRATFASLADSFIDFMTQLGLQISRQRYSTGLDSGVAWQLAHNLAHGNGMYASTRVVYSTCHTQPITMETVTEKSLILLTPIYT